MDDGFRPFTIYSGFKHNLLKMQKEYKMDDKDSIDIVDWLRRTDRHWQTMFGIGLDNGSRLGEAADEISRLRADLENDKMDKFEKFVRELSSKAKVADLKLCEEDVRSPDYRKHFFWFHEETIEKARDLVADELTGTKKDIHILICC